MPFVGFAAGLAAPELGPPGGSRFGPAFIFGDCPSQVFGIAMSGAAPFWGPPGGPRNGSVRTKYVYGWGRQAAPVLSSVFRPYDFPSVFFASPCPGRGHFGVRLVDPESGPRTRTPLWWVRHVTNYSMRFALEICAGVEREERYARVRVCWSVKMSKP